MSVSVGFIIAHPSSPSSSYFSLEPKLSSGVVSTVFNRQQQVRLQVLGEVLYFSHYPLFGRGESLRDCTSPDVPRASSARWTNANRSC